MATNPQHFIGIKPCPSSSSSSSSSSWAPLAPSAALVGWENVDAKPSILSGYKRPRVSSPPAKKQEAVNKEKSLRKINNRNNKSAAKVPKKQNKETIDDYKCTWENNLDAVLTVTKDCVVCLVGSAHISVEVGKVEIFGYQIDNSHRHPTVRVESPSWNSLITVWVDAHSSLSIKSTCNESVSFSVHSPSDKGVRPSILPPSWVKAADNILQDFISSRQRRCTESELNSLSSEPGRLESGIVVCGAKGVGKSTCLRYLSNRLLSTPGGWDCVAILDADVGQPELSPPGMISLTLLRKPLLSPPHLHMVMSKGEDAPIQYSYFYGSISPKSDPQRYLHCVQLLRDKYNCVIKDGFSDDPFQLPLLINTDGWVKGLGFQILSTLLADTLQPCHIIQIQGEARSKLFELDETVVTTHRKLHMATAYTYGGNVQSSFPPNTATAEAPTRLSASAIPSAAWRSLRFCTYFLGDTTIWNEESLKFGNVGIVDVNYAVARRLAAMEPYVVPMEAVKCGFLGEDFMDLASSETAFWQVLNGSIVGLCIGAIGPTAHYSLPCVGLGLIRAVDRARRLFYVLTPVDANALQSVNVFLVGSLQLPIECWFRGQYSESFPFLSCEGFAMGVIGADSMRSRNNIARKGYSNPLHF